MKKNNYIESVFNRLSVLGLIFMSLFIWLIAHLYQLQVMEGENYQEAYISQIKKSRLISGTRGRIFDRNGNLLAENRISYDLVLEDVKNYRTTRERQGSLNGIAFQMVTLVEDEEKFNHVIPVKVQEQGGYIYTEEGFRLNRFKADLFGKSSIEDLSEEEKGITADELMVYLCSSRKFLVSEDNSQLYEQSELEQYGLPKTLSRSELLHVVNIRYGLSLNSYQKYLPFLVAADISENTMAAVLEQKAKLPGADILSGTVRVYTGGESLSGILGYTGQISSEELTSYGDGSGYTSLSVVGKSGIEKSLEEWLKGKDGMEEFYTDVVGLRKTDEQQITASETGNDVYLTIDMELQDTVYQLLEQQIAGILLANMVNVRRSDLPKTREASQIRIPVDDVFVALFRNHVIDTDSFGSSGASQYEKDVKTAFDSRKNMVLEEMSQSFDKNQEAMIPYYDHLIECMERDGLLSKDAPAWNPQEQTVEVYMTAAVEGGYIQTDNLKSGEKYLDMKTMVSLVQEASVNALREDSAFDLLIYEAMVREESLSGYTVLHLMYEQGMLSKDDPDYVLLNDQSLSEWELVRNKIRNLEITPAQLALDPCSGSAVVTDPQNGQVLACVSYPGYDNNRLANVMDQAYYQDLAQDLALPLFNRATSQLTAPGSTFKPVTVIAGLKEGVITEETSLVCDGVFDRVDPSLRCWNRMGHGLIAGSAEALKNSCNDYLCEITYLMGSQETGIYTEEEGLRELQKYAALFDLDKNTGIELGEAKPKVTDQYAIPSSIGQGTHNYTTTQIARYTGTLANHGTSYQLSLVDKITDGNGNLIQSFTPVVESHIELPETVWNNVGEGMRNLAASNKTLKSLEIEAAGKTGTAEESKTRPNHGWLIAYAPYGNPQLALAVRISNGYSSGNVVSVGRDIINAYFRLKEKEKLVTGKAASVSDNVRTD